MCLSDLRLAGMSGKENPYDIAIGLAEATWRGDGKSDEEADTSWNDRPPY